MSGDPQLTDIYRKTVLTHSRQPRNFRRLVNADREAVGHNPLCGDKLTVYINLNGDQIADLTFEGSGCAISLASASIMTEQMRGLDGPAAKQCIDRVVNAFAAGEDGESGQLVDDMASLSGVKRYPSRIKCATLAWKTLGSALDARDDVVTTESQELRQ